MPNESKYPKILVLKYKYGTDYLLIENEQSLLDNALAIFLDRDNQGYYGYKDDVEKPEPPEVPTDLNNQPDYVQKEYAKRSESYKRDLAYYDNWQTKFGRVEAIRDEANPNRKLLAWKLLWSNRDNEYEGISLVLVKTEYNKENTNAKI